MPFGQHAVDVVQPHRHKGGVRIGARQVIQPAFKRQHGGVVAGVARAFGENNQRFTLLQSGTHGVNYLLRILVAAAIHQQAVKHVFDNKTADAPAQPVIRSGHRPRVHAPLLGQRHPHQHTIAVAIVVGVIHGLARREIKLLRRFGAHTGDK